MPVPPCWLVELDPAEHCANRFGSGNTSPTLAELGGVDSRRGKSEIDHIYHVDWKAEECPLQMMNDSPSLFGVVPDPQALDPINDMAGHLPEAFSSGSITAGSISPATAGTSRPVPAPTPSAPTGSGCALSAAGGVARTSSSTLGLRLKMLNCDSSATTSAANPRQSGLHLTSLAPGRGLGIGPGSRSPVQDREPFGVFVSTNATIISPSLGRCAFA